MRLYNDIYQSRLLLGTAQYPSPQILSDAVRASKPALVTVSLRRESAGARAGDAFWGLIQELELVFCQIQQAATAQEKPLQPQIWRVKFLKHHASSLK